MKKFRILSLVLLMFSALNLVSCDTEPVDPVLNNNNNNGENPNNPNNPNNPSGGVFKVDFEGETFVAQSATAKYENGLLVIVGAKAPSEVVSVGVSGTAEGTYTETTCSYIPSANSQTGYMNINPATFANNGTVTITEIDYENNTVSGTFSFTAYSVNPAAVPASIVFANGSFENIPVTGLPDPGTEPEQYMKAKVDGQQVNFGTIMAAPNMGTLMLSGTNAASQEFLTLNLPEDITPGTYALETFSDYYATYLGFSGTSIPSDSGTITIISHTDGSIKGTFSFSGEDFDGNPHSITNGEFNIHY
ncbi:MAG: hypothetical protein DI539_14990 [Flavobacterium psychrophilum]|nr:MAG: hypothetical protein DI539_14990 [Flavobacterium psychrophilum]